MVTKEQIDKAVAAARNNPTVSVYRPYIAALADENDRLRAENATLHAQLAEAVAWIEMVSRLSVSKWTVEEARALAKKLKGTP